MPFLVESISLFRIGLGVSVGLLAVALVEFGYYSPSPLVAVALALLLLVITAQGIQPFGDTIAYQLLQAAVFAVFGLTVMIVETVTLIAAVFTFVGSGGVLYYGRRAIRGGIWSPVSG